MYIKCSVFKQITSIHIVFVISEKDGNVIPDEYQYVTGHSALMNNSSEVINHTLLLPYLAYPYKAATIPTMRMMTHLKEMIT